MSRTDDKHERLARQRFRCPEGGEKLVAQDSPAERKEFGDEHVRRAVEQRPLDDADAFPHQLGRHRIALDIQQAGEAGAVGAQRRKLHEIDAVQLEMAGRHAPGNELGREP